MMKLRNLLRMKPKLKPMENKPMSAEILKPSVTRAVDSYKKLQAAHAAAAAKILEQDARINSDSALIAEYKALLDEVFPDNGGSMGGISE